MNAYATSTKANLELMQAIAPGAAQSRQPDEVRARKWLNKKHFTSDSGATLDCIAILPNEHAIAINIGQLCELLAAFAQSIQAAARQQIEDLRRLAPKLETALARTEKAEQQLAEARAQGMREAVQILDCFMTRSDLWKLGELREAIEKRAAEVQK